MKTSAVAPFGDQQRTRRIESFEANIVWVCEVLSERERVKVLQIHRRVASGSAITRGRFDCPDDEVYADLRTQAGVTLGMAAVAHARSATTTTTTTTTTTVDLLRDRAGRAPQQA